MTNFKFVRGELLLKEFVRTNQQSVEIPFLPDYSSVSTYNSFKNLISDRSNEQREFKLLPI